MSGEDKIETVYTFPPQPVGYVVVIWRGCYECRADIIDHIEGPYRNRADALKAAGQDGSVEPLWPFERPAQ